MIKGLGTDIIEIERVRKSIDRHGESFINKLFTKGEQNYCNRFKNPLQSFSGRFAAKEAIAKALGTGFGKTLSFKDIEILKEENGKPIVRLSEKAQAQFENPDIFLSISHTEHYATAVAICLN